VPPIDRLIDASGSLDSVRKFVATDELQLFLASFADVELKAAREALRAHERSRSRHRELEDALGHLRSAHVAFSEAYKSGRFSTIAEEDKAIHMDVLTCCLMALCYRHLDEADLMNDYVGAAYDALQHGSIAYQMKRALTPRGYMRATKQSAALFVRPIHHLKGMATNPEISTKQLDRFRDNLRAL
jgi:hypothetical protein